MKTTAVLLILVTTLMTTPVLAEQQQCAALSDAITKKWGWGNEKVPCQCGAELSNLTITLPAETHVEGVCGLVGSDGTKIDLTKSKISVDKYDQMGGYPQGGVIYISGELVLTGKVVVEPSNCCAMWFEPNLTKSKTESVFYKNFFSSIRIESDEDYKKFRAPDPNYVKCVTAEATIRVRGFESRLIGNDEQGTYPRHLEVLKVSGFKECP